MRRVRQRVNRRSLLVVALGTAIAVAVASTLVVVFSGGDTYRFTARFSATPGLYADNSVDVLGVPKGHIVSVKPSDSYVEVVIELPTSVKIPARARAVLMAPNPVSDRFVELTPPYLNGPTIRDGGVIDLKNTVVPLELDSIYSSVDDLSKMLGPDGANKGGALSSVLHSFAQLANGRGTDLHQAIEKISAALPALTAHPDELKNLVTGLDTLTSKLAAHDTTINDLYDDLATATGQLADERQTISAAISNLQLGLAQVASFIKNNADHLGSSVKKLNTTIGVVMSEQKALIQTFDTAPLGFQNFNRAIDPNSPCLSATGAPNNCTALWARLDVPADVWTFVKKYCGDNILYSILPILAQNARLGQATATHTACGALIGLVAQRTGPPGSPKTPDLDLSHSLGSR
ncbi:MAG: phospholipid/cholesterol/gamma-HCH transport system substrate-binding protein [Pseudonocardiales bacterium]|nr:phospholipid/cholesterol/gamma-HCH transport system substrate-binding protein [Pseudonocardiales bacterium]